MSIHLAIFKELLILQYNIESKMRKCDAKMWRKNGI